MTERTQPPPTTDRIGCHQRPRDDAAAIRVAPAVINATAGASPSWVTIFQTGEARAGECRDRRSRRLTAPPWRASAVKAVSTPSTSAVGAAART